MCRLTDIEIDILIRKKEALQDEVCKLQAEIERLRYNLNAVLEERADYSEAITEFAERLCEGRVANDPVVIAVKAELKMTEKG